MSVSKTRDEARSKSTAPTDRSNFPWLIKYSNPPADLRASLAVNTKDGHRRTLHVPRLLAFQLHAADRHING